jgi:tetratricopeptide (TPR) repeat protein
MFDGIHSGRRGVSRRGSGRGAIEWEGTLGKRKRISKRGLKHDALLESAARGTRFIDEHLNKVIIGAVVIVAVILGGVVISRSRRATELAANGALIQATQTLQTGLLAQASELYDAVIDEYPGTRSARAATCFLGSIAYRQGLYDQALEHFDSFLAGRGAAGNLRTIALEGKAAIMEQRHEFATAASLYEDLARHAGDLDAAASRYLGNALRCFRSAGDWPSTMATATRIIEDHPDTAWETEARMALAEAQAHSGT